MVIRLQRPVGPSRLLKKTSARPCELSNGSLVEGALVAGAAGAVFGLIAGAYQGAATSSLGSLTRL